MNMSKKLLFSLSVNFYIYLRIFLSHTETFKYYDSYMNDKYEKYDLYEEIA
jgi:hypothetical protein